MSASEALLARIVDYAGLFPPAALDMESAVKNYQTYLNGNYAWMLGSFVVSASRLDEFRQAFEDICCGEQEHPWTLSVVCAGDLAADQRAVEDFQEGAVFLAALETKVADANSAAHALAALPSARARYLEFAPDQSAQILPILAANKARAKLRTGGVTPDSIPPVDALTQFIKACARERVAFKATAGLHFPIRAEHHLAPNPNSPTATMHGFVNVFLAAALAYFGADADAIAATLSEEDPTAFTLDDDVVRWHDNVLTSDQLERVRRDFAVSFGSCSFEEPVDGLRSLGWL